MMTDTIERPSTDKITEPAKQWRNWFVVVTVYFSLTDNRRRHVGEKLHGQEVWPSKDIAEQKAISYVPTGNSAIGKGYLEYLGAYPEGVTP